HARVGEAADVVVGAGEDGVGFRLRERQHAVEDGEALMVSAHACKSEGRRQKAEVLAVTRRSCPTARTSAFCLLTSALPHPISTSLNLATGAPCATRIVCIGSPFPQFGSPQMRQLARSATASQERQNSGVVPV